MRDTVQGDPSNSETARNTTSREGGRTGEEPNPPTISTPGPKAMVPPAKKRPKLEMDYTSMTVESLRKECRRNLVFPKGTKDQLVDRLMKNERDKLKMNMIRFISTKRTREQDEGHGEDQDQTAQDGMSPMKKHKKGPLRNKPRTIVTMKEDERKGSRCDGGDEDDDDDDDMRDPTRECVWEGYEDEGGGAEVETNLNRCEGEVPTIQPELTEPTNVNPRGRNEAQGGKGRVEGEEIEEGGGEATPSMHQDQARRFQPSSQIWPKLFKWGGYMKISVTGVDIGEFSKFWLDVGEQIVFVMFLCLVTIIE